jgi:lauroyl/myristoyl acyltransferase
VSGIEEGPRSGPCATFEHAARRAQSRAVLLAYQVGAALTRAAPLWAVVAGSRVIGACLWALMTERRAALCRNLSRVIGEPAGSPAVRRASRRAFYYYVYYWMEAFRLPGTAPEELDRHMSAEGLPILEEAASAGRGVIMALPHLGSWEYAGAWMSTVGMPLTVVAEPVEPRELFEWFVRLRSELGMTVVALGPEAAPAVLAALRSGKVAGLLADRDITGTGVEVELFGDRTTLPGGPATLALRTGAALLPTAIYTLGRGQHLGVVRPPIPLERTGSLREDVARVTQAMARELEALIRRAPEQWHILQPNWPSDRRP